MPRKKTAQQAGSESTQPVKKFKSDSTNSSLNEPIGRRSLRNRSQDENKVEGAAVAHASTKAVVNEVGDTPVSYLLK